MLCLFYQEIHSIWWFLLLILLFVCIFFNKITSCWWSLLPKNIEQFWPLDLIFVSREYLGMGAWLGPLHLRASHYAVDWMSVVKLFGNCILYFKQNWIWQNRQVFLKNTLQKPPSVKDDTIKDSIKRVKRQATEGEAYLQNR